MRFSVVALLVSIAASPISQAAGGSGTVEDPFLIGTAQELNAIGANVALWDRHFRLTADIDLSGVAFNMIGGHPHRSPPPPFSGSFDGDGHVVRNLKVEIDDRLFAAMFVQNNGEIRNLGIVNAVVDLGSGGSRAAPLVSLNRGIVENCYAEGGRVFGLSAGGLVAANNSTGHIIECWSSCRVAAPENYQYKTEAGGIAAVNSGNILRCYSVSQVRGKAWLGGLVGQHSFGLIADCYATGDVAGVEIIGGLIGRNQANVHRCYSTGSLSLLPSEVEDPLVGGLVGQEFGGTVVDSFWDAEASGVADGAPGTGLPTAAMQSPPTYADAGWDFDDGTAPNDELWYLPAGGGYPKLRWKGDLPPPPLPFEAGSGTEQDPYLVSNADHLRSISQRAEYAAAHYRMTGDIDLSNEVIPPLGGGVAPFSGDFDGGGFAVFGLEMVVEQQLYLGLFGNVSGANIRDLTLVEPVIESESPSRAGALASWVQGGSVISNCHVIGGRVLAKSKTGGLVGESLNSNFADCSASCAVRGDREVGGLVGWFSGYANVLPLGTMTDCHASGPVEGRVSRAGGLIGSVGGDRLVLRCSATGDVFGDDEVGGMVGVTYGVFRECFATGEVESSGGSAGGFAGEIRGSGDSEISDCYATGVVNGKYGVGGFIGFQAVRRDTVGIVRCYSTGPALGESSIGGFAGAVERPGGDTHASFWNTTSSGSNESPAATPATSAEMQFLDTFTVEGIDWDFDSVWVIPPAQFPRLRWEGIDTSIVGEPYPGTGTEADPFRIATALQLLHIGYRSEDWSGHFRVVENIDLSTVDLARFYQQIGGGNEERFDGLFDGGHKTVFDFDNPGGGGLFAKLPPGGLIRDLTILGAEIGAFDAQSVGALIDDADGEIVNCHVASVRAEGHSRVGGLAGKASSLVDCSARSVDVSGVGSWHGGLVGLADVVSRCWSSGTVNGGQFTGGLVGAVIGGDPSNLVGIDSSFSTADVMTDEAGLAGGLVGYINDQPLAVRDSYALGDVHAESDGSAGGLIGGSSESSFRNCFAAGAVSSVDGAAGGLVGGVGSPWGETSGSFWDIETSGTTIAIGEGEQNLAGVQGLPTVSLQSDDPYLTEGWDLEAIWRPTDHDYPHLQWERVELLPRLPGTVFTFIETDAEWSYWDRGSLPEGDWTQVGFADGEWDRGQAELGYGDGDEATEVDSGDDPENKHITTYFRYAFHVDAAMLRAKHLRVDVKFDDGVRAYLNGDSILVSNLSGRARPAFDLLADAAIADDGNRWFSIVLPTDRLQIGDNVLAAEVHQHTPDSDDLSFALRFSAILEEPERNYPGSGIRRTDPYLIANAAQLVRLSHRPSDWDRGFQQAADIDLSKVAPLEFDTIGNAEIPFTGNYDGEGFRLSNLNDPGRTGLFGQMNGGLHDITLVDPIVSAPDSQGVGALAGEARGSMESCHVIGGRIEGKGNVGGLGGSGTYVVDCSAQQIEVVASTWGAGGLFGFGSEVIRCWSSGSVRGLGSVGGLVGSGFDIGFSFSRANVEVTGNNSAGGLMGSAYIDFPVAFNCYATGDVTGPAGSSIGGIVGELSEAAVDRCFAVGRLIAEGDAQVGGLVGYSEGWYDELSVNIWDAEASGIATPIGSFGDIEDPEFIGLDTAEAQTAAPYLAAGWDFVDEEANGDDDFWRTFPGAPDYPHLWWEPVPDPDSDGDALDDGWEFTHFGSLDQNAGGDPDGDGFSNLEEQAAGTDPNDPDSSPQLLYEKLLAEDGTPGNEFGRDVAISRRTLAVGAPEANAGAGAVYLFTRQMLAKGAGGGGEHDQPRWVQVNKLSGGDQGAQGFGHHVALHRGTLVVSAERRVLVFESDGDDPALWSLVTELDSDETEPVFQPPIALYRDTILTRALIADAPAIAAFERRGGSWTHTDTIVSPEPQPVDHFGSVLALHGRTALAGSADGIFVFRRNPFTRRWGTVTKLEERDDEEVELAIALHRNTAVVAGQDLDGEGEPELARVYHRFAGGFDNWGQIASLSPQQDNPELEREHSVALRAGTLVIGSPLDETAGEAAGRLHVFKRRLRGPQPWVLDRSLLPTEVDAKSFFGSSVALSGNQIVASAPAFTADGPGSAYVVPVHQRNRFRVWLAHFFSAAELDDPEVAALSADPDDDGLNNEIEFALGLDPTSPDEDEDYLPSVSVATDGKPDNDFLTFSFSLPESLPADLTYQIQSSADLVRWNVIATREPNGEWAGDASISEHVADDGRHCVIVHDTLGLSENMTRYLRLGVQFAE